MDIEKRAKELKNEYRKRWYHKNKDKEKEYRNNFWIRQAQKELAEMKPYDKEAGKHD